MWLMYVDVTNHIACVVITISSSTINPESHNYNSL